jgi:hypothetical protein
MTRRRTKLKVHQQEVVATLETGIEEITVATMEEMEDVDVRNLP